MKIDRSLLAPTVLASALLASAPPAGAAEPVTPQQAQVIQGQIDGWFQTTFGPAAQRLHVTVTAAGDHYDLAYPLANADGNPPVTGKLTVLDGGRWSIDGVAYPSPTVFHVTLPAGQAGAPSQSTSTLTLGQQQQAMLIDPSFKTPSTLTGSFADLDLTMQIAATPKVPGGTTQISHVDSATSKSTLTPVGDGRVDVVTDATFAGYSLKTSLPAEQQPLTMAIGKATFTSTLTGVSTDRAARLISLVGQLNAKSKTPPPAGAAKSPPDRTVQLALLGALADLASGGVIDEQLSDASVNVGGITGTMDRIGFGLDAKAADGKLQARMPLSAAGLHMPGLDLGTMERLVPTLFSLTPRIGGLSTDALMQLARKAAADQTPDDTDVQALFRGGPIDVGVDDFHLDVAGARFAGHVAMQVASPDSIAGTGQIVADGFDGLQQAVMANPQTAQGAAILGLAKSLARPDGDHLTWNIAYRDGHLLVNDQDMQALIAAMSPPAPPPAAPPAKRAPPRAPAPTRP